MNPSTWSWMKGSIPSWSVWRRPASRIMSRLHLEKNLLLISVTGYEGMWKTRCLRHGYWNFSRTVMVFPSIWNLSILRQNLLRYLLKSVAGTAILTARQILNSEIPQKVSLYNESMAGNTLHNGWISILQAVAAMIM